MHAQERGGRRTPARLVLSGLVVAATLAGCSASTSGTKATGTTSAAATTTAAPVPKAKLQALLPTAADLNPNYKIDTSGDSSGGQTDAAMEKAMANVCPPDAAAVLQSTGGNGVATGHVDRSFSTKDSRAMSVNLGPVDPTKTEAELTKIIAAVGKCGTLTFTDDRGYHYSMTLSAERDDTYGDIGLLVHIKFEVSGSDLSSAIPFEMRVREFHQGSVDVSITATSGVDNQTGAPVSGDFGVLDSLSKDLDTKVAAAQR